MVNRKLFVMLSAMLCLGFAYADNSDWMSKLEDTVYLSELTIPGTHDSGALHETFPDTAKCQRLTIPEQLNCGTRFLDIRCRRIDNVFKIYHGSAFQYLDFQDVVDYCRQFLKAHPFETIIMLVKEESSPKNSIVEFEEIFHQYISKNIELWHLDDKLPKLGDVRGKIVLIRRFSVNKEPLGIHAKNWKDNTTCQIDSTITIKLQDKYHTKTGRQKWQQFNNLLTEAAIDSSTTTLYLNYTSGYKSGTFNIPRISPISDYMNPLVDDFFAKTKGRFGVIVMDFATPEINSKIIAANSRLFTNNQNN